MRSHLPVLALTLSLAACVPAGTGSSSVTHPVAAHVSASARPSAAPSGALVGPIASTAPDLLQKPTGASVLLKGQITLDASYIVGQQGGTVVATDGSGVIATDGSGVIATDGSGVIATDGAGLVNATGNAVISNDGGSLVPDDGVGLVATGAGNVVATDGSGVIATDGAGLGATGPGARRLLQVSSVPIGEELPIGGMQVRVFSLETGKPLPLGADAAGKSVGTILTNRKGEFQVYLPPDLVDANVRVVAAVRLPGNKALRYDLITPLASGAELDDDTQLISQYMLEIYTSRARYLMQRDPAQLSKSFGIGTEFALDANLGLATQHIVRWQGAVKGRSPAELDALYARFGQLLLGAKATSIFSAVPLPESGFYGADRLARLQALYGADPTAFDVLRDLLHRVRLAADKRLAYVQANDPNPAYRARPVAYLDDLPVVQAYRALQAKSAFNRQPPFHIQQVTDFTLFMVRAYMADDLTGCAVGVSDCDPFDPNGVSLSEKRKLDGIARILEGAPPEPVTPSVTLPSDLASLFITAPNPADPPQLGSGYQGPGALPAGIALARDASWGLEYGNRGISLGLLVPLLFTPQDQWDDNDRVLHQGIDALLGLTGS